MTKVFLSGAVEGCNDRGCGWRESATPHLQQWGYEVVNPVLSQLEEDVLSVEELVEKNLKLQKQCDLLLVEYNLNPRCYVGTDYELVMAKEILDQPAIVWAHEAYRDRIYLQYLATAILPSLHEAMNFLFRKYPPN